MQPIPALNTNLLFAVNFAKISAGFLLNHFTFTLSCVLYGGSGYILYSQFRFSGPLFVTSCTRTHI